MIAADESNGSGSIVCSNSCTTLVFFSFFELVMAPLSNSYAQIAVVHIFSPEFSRDFKVLIDLLSPLKSAMRNVVSRHTTRYHYPGLTSLPLIEYPFFNGRKVVSLPSAYESRNIRLLILCYS